jgi:hypothetical protein
MFKFVLAVLILILSIAAGYEAGLKKGNDFREELVGDIKEDHAKEIARHETALESQKSEAKKFEETIRKEVGILKDEHQKEIAEKEKEIAEKDKAVSKYKTSVDLYKYSSSLRVQEAQENEVTIQRLKQQMLKLESEMAALQKVKKPYVVVNR